MNEAVEIAPGVAHLLIGFVNVYFVGEAGASGWTLVDSGIPRSAPLIRAAAQRRYGAQPPQAIVLTHGHFDHAGSALRLADEWNVPVYAHRLELPYLSGRASYPPPDPTIGGAIAFISRFMPRGGLDITPRIKGLPAGTQVPGMDGWRCCFTPGHSPGHVAFFRDADRTLLAGDAVATVNMDSWTGMISKAQEMARAGAPFTCDWQQALESVRRLAELHPRVLACGHGVPMTGSTVSADLQAFSEHVTPPAHGRYAAQPAQTDGTGVVWLPPAPADALPVVAAAAMLGLVGLAAARMKRGRGSGR